jgi:uncharacterized membrane protein
VVPDPERSSRGDERTARRERFRAGPSTRVAVSAAAGITVSTAVAFLAAWEVALLAGWDAALAVYVAWVWASVGAMDAQATQRVAGSEDLSHAAAEFVLIVASVMNLVAVALALVHANDGSFEAAALINVATVLSVSLSWAAVHTVFTLRYARLYYDAGGLRFEDGPPDYLDFAYVAFTIGMTYQVSDTAIVTKAMRRVALRHTLLSYLFGAVIGATVINVVVGLFRG